MKYRKRLSAAVLALAAAFYTGTCSVYSAADSSATEGKSLEELETIKIKNNVRLESLQRGIEKARKDYENATKKEASRKEYDEKLSEKIDIQNQNLEYVVRQINMLESEVQNTSDLASGIEWEMAECRREADVTLNLFKQRLRITYMSGTDNLASVLMGSASFSDILSRAELVSRIAQRDTELLDSLESRLAKLNEFDDQLLFKQEIISDNLEEASAKKTELDGMLEELKKDYSENREELEKLATDRKNFRKDYDARTAAVEEQRKEQDKITDAIKKEQERLKKETELLEEQARKNQVKPSAGGNSPSVPSGASQINVSPQASGMLWPVSGYTSHSSFYGYREFDNSDHKAIDIQGNDNDTIEFAKIYAAESGKVITAVSGCTHSYGKSYSCGCGGGYGNYIVLQHSDGVYQTVYAHCYTIYVSEGDTVRRGQLIGLVGSTGYSTGPHLHFEVRKDGVKTNPDSYTYINYG